MIAIGIMSGTSLDGVDVALVEISGKYKDTVVKLLNYKSYEIDDKIKNKIKDCCSLEKSDVRLVCSLNFELGELFAKCTLDLIKESGLTTNEIDYIASHGQTVWHIPVDNDNFSKSTLQIGDPSVISARTGIKVVSNFREKDMAVGGTGAPLVPYVDYIMFSNDEESVAMHNIGGIANTTILKKSGTEDEVIAFDTGPGNMMIDQACLTLFNKSYDKDGNFASKGKVIKEMYDEIMSHPFFKKTPPKATGREEFGEFYVMDLLEKYRNENPYDIVNTLTRVTADSISEVYLNFKDYQIDKIVITGGGSYNPYLVSLIKERLDNIYLFNDYGFSSDSKEAVQFAVLGNEFLNGMTANLPSVTNAKVKTILGRMSI